MFSDKLEWYDLREVDSGAYALDQLLELTVSSIFVGRACVPVAVWKQCRSNVSASSSSIPVQPVTGESWLEMAWRECQTLASRRLSLVSSLAIEPKSYRRPPGLVRQIRVCIMKDLPSSKAWVHFLVLALISTGLQVC